MPETILEQQTETDLKSLAQDIVRRAMHHAASAAECVIREGDEFSTLVRLGQVETLKESGSKAIGVRVFYGKRSASTYSSDFSREGLDRMLNSALELAKITSEDPFAGVPDPSQLGSIPMMMGVVLLKPESGGEVLNELICRFITNCETTGECNG